MMLPVRVRAWRCHRAGCLVLFAAAACMRGDTGGDAALKRVEVVPSTTPRLLGVSESLARVQDVKVGVGDTIWALNSADPFLIAFAPDSDAPARAWGKLGSGPREFVSPTALGRGPDGRVWVFDQGRHALIRANGSEDDWTEIPLPRDSLPPARIIGSDQIGMIRPWMASRAGAFVFAVTTVDQPAAPRMWNARLVALEPGGTPHTVFSTADRIDDPGTRWPALTTLMPHPLWDVCADGAIVAYDPLENAIRWFADGSDVSASAPLPDERMTAVTPDRMFQIAYRDAVERFPSDRRPDSTEMRRQFDAQMQSFGAQFGTVFPEYADLRCAPNGEVWIQQFDVDAGQFGKGRVWLRATADGPTTGIRLPDGFTPYQFLGDRLLGVLTDDFDVASIAAIDL